MSETPQDKVNEAIQRTTRAGSSLATYIEDRSGAIAKRLPTHLQGQGDRFASIATSTILSTPTLRDCTPNSLMRCVVQAACHGLTVDGVLGHAYLVPFKNRGAKEAQLQIGYRGFVELIIRSGKFSRVAADVVYTTDAFDYVEGTNAMLAHRRDLVAELGGTGRGEAYAAYAIAHPSDGSTPTFVVLSKADVIKRRDSSKAYKFGKGDSPWDTHPDAMWRKSAIRELAKLLPLSDERYAQTQALALRDEARDEGRPVQEEVVDVELEVSDAG